MSPKSLWFLSYFMHEKRAAAKYAAALFGISHMTAINMYGKHGQTEIG